MADNQTRPEKGEFVAAVLFNRQVRPRFYRIGLDFEGSGAEAFGVARPGQFAQLDLSGAALPASKGIPEDLADAAGRKIILRRPFSFADVATKGNKATVEIFYKVVGPASLRMTTLKAGDSISVIGPLGNGFSVPAGKKRAVLAVGGMGAGPLLHLTKVLTAKHIETDIIAFVGAKAKEELPFEKPLDEVSRQLGFSLSEFAKYGVKSSVATDDGSLGYHGLVTDCLAEWLAKAGTAAKEMIIYACGPEAMLARTAEIAKEKNIDCQLSMERMMACGIGVCQSCAVECKVDGSNKTVYKLCCKDGPVFDGKEVVF